MSRHFTFFLCPPSHYSQDAVTALRAALSMIATLTVEFSASFTYIKGFEDYTVKVPSHTIYAD